VVKASEVAGLSSGLAIGRPMAYSARPVEPGPPDSSGPVGSTSRLAVCRVVSVSDEREGDRGGVRFRYVGGDVVQCAAVGSAGGAEQVEGLLMGDLPVSHQDAHRHPDLPVGFQRGSNGSPCPAGPPPTTPIEAKTAKHPTGRDG